MLTFCLLTNLYNEILLYSLHKNITQENLQYNNNIKDNNNNMKIKNLY